MKRIIPSITISQEQHFTTTGTPDATLYVIDVTIDTPDEYDQIGRIEFQDAESLLNLRAVLDSYIRKFGIDQPDEAHQAEEGGDK